MDTPNPPEPVRAEDVLASAPVVDFLGGEGLPMDEREAAAVIAALLEAAGGGDFAVVDGALCAVERSGECSEEHDVTGTVTIREPNGEKRTVQVTLPHLDCCVPEGFFRVAPVLGEPSGSSDGARFTEGKASDGGD